MTAWAPLRVRLVYGRDVPVTVAVVVPARNDAASLRAAVEHVLDQRGVVIDELVIAVGPSTDGTDRVAAELATDFAVVRVIDNPSGQTPCGLNLAIEATTNDIVARVDARSILPEGYLAAAVQTMAEVGAGNVGAIQRPLGKTVRQRAIAAAMASPFGSGGAAYRVAQERRRVDTAYLGVFQRDALMAVGGYDETFIRNQDAELNLRLNKAGHQVWIDPRLVVDYYPRATLSGLRSQFWQYGWWRQRTIRKHATIKLRQLVVPIVVFALAASIVLALLVSPWALLVPALYGVLMVGFALVGSGSLVERFISAAALMIMHVSWGTGFLCSAVASLLGIHKE